MWWQFATFILWLLSPVVYSQSIDIASTLKEYIYNTSINRDITLTLPGNDPYMASAKRSLVKRDSSSIFQPKTMCGPYEALYPSFYLIAKPVGFVNNVDAIDWSNAFLYRGPDGIIKVSSHPDGLLKRQIRRLLEFCIDRNLRLLGRVKMTEAWKPLQQKPLKNTNRISVRDAREAAIRLGSRGPNIYKIAGVVEKDSNRRLKGKNGLNYYLCPSHDRTYFLSIYRVGARICPQVQLEFMKIEPCTQL